MLALSNVFLLFSAALVFMMHLGFASLEAGLTRSKNTVNILFKNMGVLSLGILSFALIGFNLMYPGDNSIVDGLLGFAGFGLDSSLATVDYNENYTYWTDFIFQAMFAATAATIVSGAVAERMKLGSFLLFALLLVGISYPITGMWHWGGGFLSTMETPFYDFAGSTVVHTVGGWAALIAVMMLGPRLGRFSKKKEIRPHNFPFVTFGVFLLWFGWFGFNGGSVLSANPELISLVYVITLLGGTAGTISAMFLSWRINKRPDLANTLNGALAGLVSITAGADVLTPFSAVIVAFIAGIVVVYSARFFNYLKLDDPVGAISVHLVVGVWGTLAVGIFGQNASLSQFMAQVIGVCTVGLFTVAFSYISLICISYFLGLRVSKKHEVTGLDISEHQDVSYDYTTPNIGRNVIGANN